MSNITVRKIHICGIFLIIILFSFNQCTNFTEKKTVATENDTIFLKTLYASSVNSPKNNYTPLNLVDGNQQTIWAPVNGSGMFEEIFMEFDKPTFIHHIWLNQPKTSEYASIRKVAVYNEAGRIGEFMTNSPIVLETTQSKLRICISETSNLERIFCYGDKKFTIATNNTEYIIGIAEVEIYTTTTKIATIEASKLNSNYYTTKDLIDSTVEEVQENTPIENLNWLLNKTIINESEITAWAIFYEDGSFRMNGLNTKQVATSVIGLWTINHAVNNSISFNIEAIFVNDSTVDWYLHKSSEQAVFKDKIILQANKIQSAFMSPILLQPYDNSLVNVLDFDSTIVLDMRYATMNNFMDTILYDCPSCLLRYRVIKDLLKVKVKLAAMNLRLKLYDCYRPYHVQVKMWGKMPNPNYVANPYKNGSIHNRGGAVDLTIIDSAGNELDMGTPFDSFSIRSAHFSTNHSDTVLNNRRLLKRLMQESGFLPVDMEWWHYSHFTANQYPLMDVALPCK